MKLEVAKKVFQSTDEGRSRAILKIRVAKIRLTQTARKTTTFAKLTTVSAMVIIVSW